MSWKSYNNSYITTAINPFEAKNVTKQKDEPKAETHSQNLTQNKYQKTHVDFLGMCHADTVPYNLHVHVQLSKLFTDIQIRLY